MSPTNIGRDGFPLCALYNSDQYKIILYELKQFCFPLGIPFCPNGPKVIILAL